MGTDHHSGRQRRLSCGDELMICAPNPKFLTPAMDSGSWSAESKCRFSFAAKIALVQRDRFAAVLLGDFPLRIHCQG